MPNCRDINASVDVNGMINFTLEDLLTNAGLLDSATITITTAELGTILYGPSYVDVTDPLMMPACQYVDKNVKVNVTTDLGGCWSWLTVKKSHGPIIQGRRFDVYCFDSLVTEPGMHPPTIDVCGGQDEATFVSDWITIYDCEAGVQDTAKVIYREWESVDKEGFRGVGYDTIVVFYLPEITADNIFCALKDTIYCGDHETYVGPYITIPGLPLATDTCTDISLIEVTDDDKDGILEFSAPMFDDLCGFNTLVYSELFKVDCSNAYKITLDVKASCYGVAQTACTVPVPAGTPPNFAEMVAPGYWHCEFWLVDLDTLPPDIHSKYPTLLSGQFDLDKWYFDIDLDGYIDTAWAPYQVSLAGSNNGDDNISTDMCITIENDTVLAFAWEFRSQNSDAMYDPFGYILNGDFFQLTEGIPGEISGPIYQNGYKILELRTGDEFCFSQTTTDGEEGRAITTIKALSTVTTSNDECVAHTYVPPVLVKDDWSGVKSVKARIPDVGSYILTYNAEEDCYESHESAALHHSPDPYIIIYEAQDSCHNTYVDTCYILVKDRVKPTAVVNKGVTVSLGDKKIWMEAAEFDEGSFDNCDINFMLVRRSDWYESCIDFCDNLENVCVTEHGDTLWKATLESNPEINEVEAYYSQQIEWFKEDPRPCGNIIYNAWIYDLMKQATLQCFDHPYNFTDDHVRDIIKECLPTVKGFFEPVALHPDPYDEGAEVDPAQDFSYDDRLLQTYDQIGGGWGDKVPFDCDDACGSVTVEILVMDYWCNWSKAWTTVWVEDKVPAQVVRDVIDTDITCKIYRSEKYELEGHSHALSIETIVDLAKDRDSTALTALDDIFGGYQKVWKDTYGNYVDENGDEVEVAIPFVDSTCYCDEGEIIKTRVFDEHLGYYWVSDTLYDCGYKPYYDTLSQGLVLANCGQFVECTQEVWCDIDHCGEGYIYRKFKIWQGCDPEWYHNESVPDSLKQFHLSDTISRIQRIKIYNECSLDKRMFDVPLDQEIVSCGIIYAEDGSGKVEGDAHPDKTGWLRYQFDDDCRLIGVSYEDKVFQIVGGESACYKIVRTWYYMDWCEGEPVDDYWYEDKSLDFDSCVQNIFLVDTIPPECHINGPVMDGDTVDVGSCYYTMDIDVDVSDSCGVISYDWQLFDVTDGGSTMLTRHSSGRLDNPTTVFNMMADSLYPGSYNILVEVQDQCGNEAQCRYNFTVRTVKKPAAICLSTITSKLTPRDMDLDGIVDTFLVTLWASEYSQSSRPACNDTALEYRIELLDFVDDDTWEEDADSIILGCTNSGVKTMRLWVISWPSGTVDYCDVIAAVQGGQECTGATGAGITLKDMTDEYEHYKAHDKSPDIGHGQIDVPLRVGTESDGGAGGFDLAQNYPNPFSESTTITFTLPGNMEASLRIYDMTGKLVKSIIGEYSEGINRVDLDRATFARGGLYYYQLHTAAYQDTRRMILLNE